MKTYQEHRIVDGKPVGVHLTVEKLPYSGMDGGKPLYGLTEVEKWKGAAILTWAGIALFVAYHFVH